MIVAYFLDHPVHVGIHHVTSNVLRQTLLYESVLCFWWRKLSRHSLSRQYPRNKHIQPATFFRFYTMACITSAAIIVGSSMQAGLSNHHRYDASTTSISLLTSHVTDASKCRSSSHCLAHYRLHSTSLFCADGTKNLYPQIKHKDGKLITPFFLPFPCWIISYITKSNLWNILYLTWTLMCEAINRFRKPYSVAPKK